VVYRGNSLRAANVHGYFFDSSWKTVPDLPQWKTNFNFSVSVLQKFKYDGSKSTHFPARLDPDLIGQNRILERAMTIRSQLDSSVAISVRSVNHEFTSMDGRQ
jgi:hypothetical protein